MKAAVIGSRNLSVDIDKYLLEVEERMCEKITLIISGGARGIDSLAEKYADMHNIPKLIFLPEYDKHGKSAPLIRNISIVNSCDMVIAFWDGVSGGTKFTVNYAKSERKKVIVYGFGKS